MEPSILLSIVLPTFNESKGDFLERILLELKTLQQKYPDNVEIIAVDSQSADNTLKILNSSKIKVITTQLQTRADRLNLGVQAANGKIILLHHPRSVITATELEILLTNAKDYQDNFWGGFTHCFDHPHWFLRYISWYSNAVRTNRKQIVYLDHCIVLSHDLASKTFPIPSMDIFEDTEISIRLQKFSQPQLLPGIALTSAIRFIENGIYRQYFTNQLMKLMYAGGMSPKYMNKIYERSLQLNTEYPARKD